MSPIDTSKKLYVFFFSGRNYKLPKHPSSWNPPKHSHWWPYDWAYFFPNVIMHYFCEIATYQFLSASTLCIHPHVSGTEHMGFLKARHSWEPGSQKSDICVRTKVIPKLGKTWISVSGHETWSNHWIFPFPPFAEGVCCERLLDVIVIPTNSHTTVCFFPKNCTFFFSGRNYEPPKHPSLWNPPKHSHWWPDDWAYFFLNIIMHYFCKIATY